jgi:hypothetical protein
LFTTEGTPTYIPPKTFSYGRPSYLPRGKLKICYPVFRLPHAKISQGPSLPSPSHIPSPTGHTDPDPEPDPSATSSTTHPTSEVLTESGITSGASPTSTGPGVTTSATGSASGPAGASHIFNSSSQASPELSTTPSPTNLTPGPAPTSDIVHSKNSKKSSTAAIVGGVVSAFAVSVLIIGAIIFVRRRRRHTADISEEREEVSPFTTPRLNRDFTGDRKTQSTAGGQVTTIASTTSSGWSPTADRDMQPRSGISNDPQRSSDANTYPIGGSLSSPVLAQLGDVVIEELLSLRTQVRQLQDVQRGRTLANGDDNNEPPPEYFSERGGGRAE